MDSKSRSLLGQLDASTATSLLQHTSSYTEAPSQKQQWHVCLSSPMLGQKTYSFDSFDDMRRELMRVMPQMTLGKIHVYYGCELPVTSDGSGANFFITNLDGQEVSIVSGYDMRVPVNEGQFGAAPALIDLDKLL